MINKINGFEEIEAKEQGEFKGLQAGPQVVRIVKVTDVADKQYIKVDFDIIKGEFTGYFKRLADMNAGEWNWQGSTYVSYKESAVKIFRNFVTALERSNNGYVFDWDENKWVGKTFVAVYGEEEYIGNDGSVRTSVKVVQCRSTQALQNGDIKTPAPKKLKPQVANPVEDVSIQDGDLPF